jgi:glycosyltransferase involved in cell wall biosynthesis
MIEAMACGTPAVARFYGSVPEVINSGVTGFIATSTEEMVEAVGRLNTLAREHCRKEFEDRFTAEVMVDQYEMVFRDLTESKRKSNSPESGLATPRVSLEAWSAPTQLPSEPGQLL